MAKKTLKTLLFGAAVAGAAVAIYKNKDKISAMKDAAVEKMKETIPADEDSDDEDIFEEGIVEEYDTTDDGKIDTVTLDKDGDGRPDELFVDTTGDGKADTAYVDTTGDGIVDTVIDLEKES